MSYDISKFVCFYYTNGIGRAKEAETIFNLSPLESFKAAQLVFKQLLLIIKFIISITFKF